MDETLDLGAADTAAPYPTVPDLVERDPVPPDQVQDAGPQSRTPGRAWVIVTVVAAVLVIVYIGAAWLLSDRVPRGTTVAGVAVGGMSSVAAEETLESSLADLTS